MMQGPCRLLLTGFEPFAGWPENPSQQVVAALSDDPDLVARGLRAAVLPVHRTRTPRTLVQVVQRLRPEVLVLLGVAGGRDALGVERIAVNCWREPGDAGAGRPIRRGAPDGRFATLPLERCVAAIERGGAPARISESAGTYACNLALYEALRWGAEGLPAGGARPQRVGFVHVPAATESLRADAAGPSLPLAIIIRGVRALCVDLLGTSRRAR